MSYQPTDLGRPTAYAWSSAPQLRRPWAEDSIPALEVLFQYCALPVKFAVNCVGHVDPVSLGDIASDINKELLTYEQRVEGVEVFSGDPRKKISREGTAYSRMTPAEAELVVPKPKSRFVTISEEVKQLKCSEISWLATEVLIGVATLYRYAYELELLLADSQRLMPLVQVPAAASQPAAHGDSDSDPDVMVEFETRWVELTSEFQRKIVRWLERNPSYMEKFAGDLGSMVKCIPMRNYHRYLALLMNVQRHLRDLMETNGRRKPLFLESPEDVILMRQSDFEYPLGMSLFELAYLRMQSGQGLDRFGKIIDEMRTHGIATDLDKRLCDMTGKIVKSVSEALQAAIQAMPQPGIGAIQLSSEFLKQVGCVIANNFFDSVLLWFNYAVANTDAATGTTIHLKAVKSVYLLQQCDRFAPVPPDVLILTSAICVNAARKTRESKKRP